MAADDATASPPESRRFCAFRLAGRLYGTDILDVKEVNPETAFTPVFHAPEEVRGLVNIRGRIHLILDLRRILGFEFREADEQSRLVLFKPAVGESFGVLVDSIDDVVEVGAERIETGGLAEEEDIFSTEPGQDPHNVVTGVCRLQDTLLLILDARTLSGILEGKMA
jgi:purine-binding chemotaxis protein CheW